MLEDRPSGLLKDVAAQYGLLREDEQDAEIVYRNVFPDIIVHKRGLNDHNLLIVELKKSLALRFSRSPIC